MRRALAAALPLALAACSGGDFRETPPCYPEIPASRRILERVEFAPLRYHKRAEYMIQRTVGYDLWADTKFEYRAALEFTRVPAKNPRSYDDLCVSSVSLRLAAPAQERSQAMLRALVAEIAPAARMDAAKLQQQIASVTASSAKYREVAREGPVTVEAGMLAHPARGEFFIVSFAWPRP